MTTDNIDMQKFRPKTLDWNIYQMIAHFDEYCLPESFEQDDLILDIGAHAGYFAETVLRSGAGKVVCYESNKENYDMAVYNLGQYIKAGNVDVHHQAVWRSDPNSDVVFHNDYEYMDRGDGQKIANTGNSFVSTKTGHCEVPKSSLDDILVNITERRKRRVRLLKIDCEGAEWPILLTSKELALVDEIHGEYHEPNTALPFPDFLEIGINYNMDLLKGHLEKNGFAVHVEVVNGHTEEKWKSMGLFFASKIRNPGSF